MFNLLYLFFSPLFCQDWLKSFFSVGNDSTFTRLHRSRSSPLLLFWLFPSLIIIILFFFNAAAAALPPSHVSGNRLQDCCREPASFSFTSFQGVLSQRAQPLDKQPSLISPAASFPLCAPSLSVNRTPLQSAGLYMKKINGCVLITDSVQLSCSCWPTRWKLTSCFRSVGADALFYFVDDIWEIRSRFWMTGKRVYWV